MTERDVILLADNSATDLELLRYAFENAGVANRVLEMRSGYEAINYLKGVEPYADRERYPLPCIIITELRMPGNGVSFLEWLRTRPEFHPVPKLVLSNSGMDWDRAKAAELGACAYFVKPSGFKDLVQVVSEIDDDWISEHCPLPKRQA